MSATKLNFHVSHLENTILITLECYIEEPVESSQ
jgi:hypothetical protein